MITRTFYQEYLDRCAEVHSYLAMLKFAENIVNKGALSSRSKRQKNIAVVRATAMLVLYNAVEASARSAVEAVYDEFESKGIVFGDLKESIRRRIISDFKNNVSADDGKKLKDIAKEIVIAGFDSRKLFSGNVDAREIRRVADRYGIDISGSDFKRTSHGAKLVEVKNHRNDLAHGHKSFSSVGRDYTTREIVQICRASLAYLDHVLLQVSQYLDQSEFLEAKATA